MSTLKWSIYALMFSRAIRFNRTHRESLRSLAKKIAGIEGCHHVLDICCGTGELLRHLRAVGWQGNYTGVDSSTYMLSYTPNDERATFIESDVQDFTVDDKYDLVVSHNGLYNWERDKVANFIPRMLRWSQNSVILINPTEIDPEAVAKGTNQGSTKSIAKALYYSWNSQTLYEFTVSFFTLLFFKLLIDKGEKMLTRKDWDSMLVNAECIVESREECYAGTGISYTLRAVE